MERFTKEHTTPLETSEKRPRFHEILLRNNFGNITAQAKLEYRNTVVPSYYISYLEVLLGSEDKKVGQELVATINHFLVQKSAEVCFMLRKIRQRQSISIKSLDGVSRKVQILCSTIPRTFCLTKIR
ncbi:MAG: hypothetical protein KBC21_02475 [Candidatus Pacebacteria bacterium]|nr:hypothetical protein [Candidatus Paceibacterota bacterium]